MFFIKKRIESLIYHLFVMFQYVTRYDPYVADTLKQ